MPKQPPVRSAGAGGGAAGTGNPNIDNLHPTFYRMLLSFVAASGGLVQLEGGSGWRSYSQQARLYSRYVSGVKGQARAAKPGSSNHNFGLAFDLIYKPGGKAWAHANAARFGLRFPMSDEDWHIEPINLKALKAGQPVGVAAYDMGPATVSPEQARDKAKEIYGYIGWFVDHPEVGPLILQGAQEGWDGARLQGALTKTNWWQTTSESARQWDALTASDPAQADRRVAETRLSLQIETAKLGIPVAVERLSDIAKNGLRYGWNQEEMKLALAAEMRWRPGQAEQGLVGKTMQDVKSIARDHMVPVNDRQAWEWTRRIVGGGATLDAVNAQMRTLAIGRFPHLADQINAGVTPGQFFAPYRNLIGRLLEQSPEQVDLMDERWSPVVSRAGDDGVRPMSYGEVERFARADPRWGKTRNAWDVGAGMLETISRIFGIAV